MLKIKNESKLKRKLKSLCILAFNNLENNGNCDFASNGEKRFLNNFISTYKDKDKDLVIFDVGANVELYTEEILIIGKQVGAYPLVHIFEPTSSCGEKLKQKLFDNQNVKLNQFGVSDCQGETNIFDDKKTSGLASLYKRNLQAYDIELSMQETIKLCRLDDYIRANNISHIDLLKIDIEGHEVTALKGLGEFINSGFINFIQFEYGGANLDSRTSLM